MPPPPRRFRLRGRASAYMQNPTRVSSGGAHGTQCRNEHRRHDQLVSGSESTAISLASVEGPAFLFVELELERWMDMGEPGLMSAKYK